VGVQLIALDLLMRFGFCSVDLVMFYKCRLIYVVFVDLVTFYYFIFSFASRLTSQQKLSQRPICSGLSSNSHVDIQSSGR